MENGSLAQITTCQDHLDNCIFESLEDINEFVGRFDEFNPDIIKVRWRGCHVLR